VYPPFDDPHMLSCRGTCHDRTQYLRESCKVVKQNLSLFIHDILEERFVHLCHHGICNERHIFVLPRCVKGTENVYEFIRYRWYIEDWSVASTLSSVSHKGIPYFLVKWGQDPHGLLLQTIIGRR
jgi:hypothetical protein